MRTYRTPPAINGLVPRLAVGLGLLLAPMLVPAVGWTQAPKARPAPAAAQAPVAPVPSAAGSGTTVQDPKVTVERGAGGKKVYRITEAIRIEGKIQKPEAFYVLQKSGINYDWQDLQQDFVPKIIESVASAPF